MSTILKNKTFRRRENGNASQAPHQPPLVGYFESAAMSMPGGGGIPKEVLATSDDVRENLTKTFFMDAEEAQLSVQCLMLYKEFNMNKDFTDMEINQLCANRGIGGMAMKEYLQAWARVVVSEDVEISAKVRSGDLFAKQKVRQLKDDEDEKDKDE